MSKDAHRNLVVIGFGRSFARRQTAPRFMTFMDDFHGILFVLGLTRKGESILGLAIGDFVDPKS